MEILPYSVQLVKISIRLHVVLYKSSALYMQRNRLLLGLRSCNSGCRVFTVEDNGNLLEGRASCLHEKEIDNKAFNNQSCGTISIQYSEGSHRDSHCNIDEIEPPSQALQSEWIDILVEYATHCGEAEAQC